MSFGNSAVLWFLIGPVALAIFRARQRGILLVIPIDWCTLPRHRRFGLLLKALETVPCLMVVLAIALLAAPQRDAPAASVRKLTNIQLCVDVSGSMKKAYGGGDRAFRRFDAAMRAISSFTKRRHGDAFGLTVFGGRVLNWVPLTTDLDAIEKAAPFLDPALLPPSMTGATFIGRALRSSIAELSKSSEGDRILIVVTDGDDTSLPLQQTAIQEQLDQKGVKLFVIHVSQESASASLDAMAIATGGRRYGANVEDFENIFSQIDALTPGVFEWKTRGSVPADEPFLLAGTALVVIYLLWSAGFRYTPW